MIVEGGLSDQELEALCKGPRFNKAATFAAAEEWYRRNKFIIERLGHPGGTYLLINTNGSAAVGKDYDEAALAYKKKSGPAPRDGRHFLGFYL